MIVACYNAAKEIYPDRTKISSTAEKIHNKTKMSKGSASDYLKDFFSMKDGKKISRCMSEKGARYYLEKIKSDFGNEAVKNAVQAVELYINNDSNEHSGLQKILDGFKVEVL